MLCLAFHYKTYDYRMSILDEESERKRERAEKQKRISTKYENLKSS
jgi:hypothetical protein